jgi:hypothetical protein
LLKHATNHTQQRCSQLEKMKNFRLILITENQNSLEKGKKFAESICETLNCENGFEISKYEKIKNSYRVEIIGKIADPNNSVSESIQLTDRICSPWIVNFDRTQNEVELIFNKSELSNYRSENFNTLNWANFVIENE